MLYKLVYYFLKIFFKICFGVRIFGDIEKFQQIYNNSAAKKIIVANHTSFLDGLLVGLFLSNSKNQQKPLFVVHTWVANAWYFKPILSLVDFLPIEPSNPMAMKTIIKSIENQNRPVVIFPEGRISNTGALMKMYDGPAFIAAKSKAQILPIFISGGVLSKYSRFNPQNEIVKSQKRWFPKITLTFLPPQQINLIENQNLQNATKIYSAREKRRIYSNQLLRIMQESQFLATMQQHQNMTLYEVLCETAELNGKNLPIIEDIKCNENPYSYKKFFQIISVLTSLVLKNIDDTDEKNSQNSQNSQNIGILLPNIAATLALILGLSAKNKTPAMLNYSAGLNAIIAACQSANLKFIVCSKAFVEQARLENKLSQLCQTLPYLKILYLEEIKNSLTLLDKLKALYFGFFPRDFVKNFCKNKNKNKNAAAILFTSGSEGTPKGVVLSHYAILANILQIKAVCDVNQNDKFINALPLFHAFGLTAGSLLPILTGVRQFIYPSPLHYRVIPEVAYDKDCSVIFGTGTFLSHYARFAHPYDFRKMRFVVSGAEKLNAEVANLWFEKFGIRVLEGYGATETAPVIAVNLPLAFKSNTVGKFLPNVEFKLEKIPGIEIGGRLFVRCPNLMNGYLKVNANGESRFEELAENAWYDSGDIADVDEFGFVKIIGRFKRFAKIAGEMVSLELSENLAIKASADFHHAVVAIADARRGEALVLFTTDKNLTRQKLTETAQKYGFAEIAIPRKIEIIETIPLLSTGKTDYVSLNQLARSN